MRSRSASIDPAPGGSAPAAGAGGEPALEPDGRAAALLDRLRRRPWRLLLDPPAHGAWNMAVDAALFAAARDGGGPVLRFYGWEPAAVSVGRFQDPGGGIRWEACRARGWDAVRRPTGGRAVLHHLELTYSIVLPAEVLGGATLRTSYSLLRSGLAAALADCLDLPHLRECGVPAVPQDSGHEVRRQGSPPGPGLFPPWEGEVPAGPPARETDGPGPQNLRAGGITPAPGSGHPSPRGGGAGGGVSCPPIATTTANCFAQLASCDIGVDGGKLVGSAQARGGPRGRPALLQHGSILLDAEPAAWEALFGAAGGLQTIRALTGRTIAREDLAASLAAALSRAWAIDLRPSSLAAPELGQARIAERQFRLEAAD